MGIDAEMYAVTKEKVTDEQIQRLSYEVGLAFGADNFIRDTKGWKYKEDGRDVVFPPHHNISRVKEIQQDGPTWRAPKGYTILKVHLMTRYYGPGYERGNLPLLVILAEWLERKLPGCEIRYGGDSSGVLAERWGADKRKKFLDHFAGPAARDYFTSRNPFMEPRQHGYPHCDFCNVNMTQYGWGGGIGNQAGAFVCHGCGKKVCTEDGKTFTEVKSGEKWS